MSFRGTLLIALCAAFMLPLSGQVHAQISSEQNVVASQGGAKITLQDVDAYAQKIPEADRAAFFDSPKRIESMIMSMLLTKHLAEEARSKKLEQDPLVQTQIAQSTDDTLARVAMQNYRKTLKLPNFEALAKEYYVSHKDEFLVRGAITVKHVLVTTKERTDDAARARIGEVEERAKAHPDQFDQLVETYSDDPSRTENHGLMNDAGSSKYVPPFVEAAKALKKPGQISPVIKTSFGYHVLKLIDRKPDLQRTYADVHDSVVEKLRSEFVERESKDHINQLRNQALDANADLVAAVRTRYLAPGAKLPSELAEEANAAATKKAAAAPPEQGQGKQH